MKVNNSFLSKIIKEEIKNVLYEEEDKERQLVRLFVKYRNYLTKSPTKNKEIVTNIEKDIKRIAPELSGPQILRTLDGKIDRQLFSFISNLLKRDKRMSSFSDKLDNYEMAISPEEQNVYQVYNKQDPDPGFMRVPKDDEAYDQEDVRKDIKTLVKENNKMKLTKEYLKALIVEELQNVNEIKMPNLKSMNDEQIMQLFVDFSKKLTNKDHSPQEVSQILNTIPPPLPTKQPTGAGLLGTEVDPTKHKLTAPLERDPKTGRPVPSKDDTSWYEKSGTGTVQQPTSGTATAVGRKK